MSCQVVAKEEKRGGKEEHTKIWDLASSELRRTREKRKLTRGDTGYRQWPGRSKLRRGRRGGGWRSAEDGQVGPIAI